MSFKAKGKSDSINIHLTGGNPQKKKVELQLSPLEKKILYDWETKQRVQKVKRMPRR